MQSDEVYVKVVGEPYLSRAQAYREQMDLYRQEIQKYMTKMGAIRANDWSLGRFSNGMVGLIFEGSKRPKGWNKPNKYGVSYPAKGNAEARAEQAEIGKLKPKSSDVFPAAEIPQDINYTDANGGYGGGGISRSLDPSRLGWIEDIYIGIIPNIPAAIKRHDENNLVYDRTTTLENNLREWKLPAGLEPMSDAEYQFLLASYKLAQEKAGA